MGQAKLVKITMDYPQAIKTASEWLVNSGIQNISDDKKKNGGINSWFDLDKKNYKYIYSEITGYGMTILVFLHHLTQDDIFLERAILAGQWVIGNAIHPSGGARTRDYLIEDKEAENYSFESGQVYSFDSGMVLFGLASLYKKNQNPEFLDVAMKIGDFLTDKCQKSDGTLYAYYDSKKDVCVDEQKKWSTQSGSFHAKIAMGLYALYEISSDEKYLKSAERLFNSSLRFQDTSGRFISFSSSGWTHLHPHSYSCEGLLFGGVKMKNDKYVFAALKGTEWALKNVHEDGTLNYIYDGKKFNDFERVDASSQVLRLGSYFLQKNMIDRTYKEKLDKMASHLLTYQNKEGEHAGGFYYGFHDSGEKLNHINSWCTMFALQALSFYNDFLQNKDIAVDYLC